jgi:hypothetical protein
MCVSRSETWQECQNIAPADNAFGIAMDALDTDMLNVTDREASLLADSLLSESAGLLSDPTPGGWESVGTVYFQLIYRCGQLIQEYQ